MAIREVMSEGVKYCFEDDDLDDVAAKMANLKVRGMSVLNHIASKRSLERNLVRSGRDNLVRSGRNQTATLLVVSGYHFIRPPSRAGL